MAKEFEPAAIVDLSNIKIYAIVDNYHDRRKTPVAIFITEKEANTYCEKLVELHERKKENYDYDIEEIVVDPHLIMFLAKMKVREVE